MINELTTLGTGGGLSALASEAHTLASCPYIGLPVNSAMFSTSKYKSVNVLKLLFKSLVKGVPIYTYKYSESADSDIGTQIVLQATQGGLALITDNVTPKPREWTIEGYVKPESVSVASSKLLGAVSTSVGNAITTSVGIMILDLYLRYVRDSRVPFYFYTKQGEKVQALIKNLKMTEDPAVGNVQQVTLTVQEFCSLSADLVSTGQALSKTTSLSLENLPTVGSQYGVPMVAQSVVAAVVGQGLPLLSSTLSKFTTTSNEPLSQEEVISEDDQEQIESLMASALDEDLLDELVDTFNLDTVELAKLLISTKNRFSNVYVAEDLASSLEVETDDLTGDRTYTQNYEVSVTFGSDVVTYTFTRGLDGIWYVTESGSVNGSSFEATERFIPNTIMHRNEAYAVIFLTSYVPYGSETSFDDLDEEQQFEAITECSVLAFTR